MTDNDLIRSAAARMLKLGGLAGRVGLSMAGNTVANIFRDLESRDESRTVTMMKNALRVKEILGQLKGVPMKIGQMISLHEKLLPAEVVKVLRSLQQNAPAVAFPDILAMVKEELGPRFALIRKIDETALAAASIGQVHRAVLINGAQIALKIQYPGIDEVIRADLKNLKGLLTLLFSMFSKMNMDAIWEEVKDRMMEELDYEKEAENIRRTAKLFEKDPQIIIPKVIDEVSSRHVLAMELVCGITPGQAAEGDFSEDLRNTWARVMVRLILKGLFAFRFLHADPNIANFAFLPDGRVIVYDFGCMKEIPESLRTSYVQLVTAFLDGRHDDLPGLLKDMGVHRSGGEPVSMDIVKDFAAVLQEFFHPASCYRFGQDADIYGRFIDIGNRHLDESMDLVFPRDIIFVDRTFAGHFGNLCRLNARADWRKILLEHVVGPENDPKPKGRKNGKSGKPGTPAAGA